MTLRQLLPGHGQEPAHPCPWALVAGILLGCCLAPGTPAGEHGGQAEGDAVTAIPDGEDSLVIPADESFSEPTPPPVRPPAEALQSGPATLDAPARAASGSQLAVRWTGPDNQGDYIAIAEPAAPGSKQASYTWTSTGSPLTVRVPDAPGQYELRYIQGQSRTVLQRQPFEVVEQE